MECLIEVYDHDQINNLLCVLAFKPSKVVMLFDEREASVEDIIKVRQACKSRVKDLVFEYGTIDVDSIDNIEEVCKKIIHDNPDCHFDITGESEIAAIAVYNACVKTFTPIFKLDLKREKIINIYGCRYLENEFKLPHISFETLLMAHGAYISGNTHKSPPSDMYDNIITFCNVAFQDVQQWKDLCSYLQIATSVCRMDKNPLVLSAPKSLSLKKGNIESHVNLNNTSLLLLAEDLSFISGFKDSNSKIKFKFKNNIFKKYMTDFGTLLEVYIYILIKRCKSFKDTRLSAVINWNKGKEDQVDVLNEIDVIFFSGIHPVFVSCKLSEPTSEALQELSIYRSYFGGKQSRCVLVTLANLKKERSHLRKRAKDMKIEIIDGKDIKDGNFINKLKSVLNVGNEGNKNEQNKG